MQVINPRDQKLLMQWNETSKSSTLDLISMNKNQVQRTRFLCIKTEFNKLDFLLTWTLCPPQLLEKYSIYNPEIKSSRLELLETKYV